MAVADVRGREIAEAVHEHFKPYTDDMSCRSDSPVPWQSRYDLWQVDTDFEPLPEQIIDDSLPHRIEELSIQKPNDYVGFITTSPAYKWLLGRLQREILLSRMIPDAMATVRSSIMISLSSTHTISRSKCPSTFKAIYEMDWNPIAFVQEDSIAQRPHDTMKLAMTVTGSASDAQASTCIDYLRQIWPSHGEHTLELIQLAVRTGCDHKVQRELISLLF
jgi:hypothetical protein